MTPLVAGLAEVSLLAVSALCKVHENNKAITALGKAAELAATGVGIVSGHALASISLDIGQRIISSAKTALHDHQETGKLQESNQQQRHSINLRS